MCWSIEEDIFMQSLQRMGKMSVYWACCVCLCFVCRSTDYILVVFDGGGLSLSHRCNCSFFRFSIILLYMNVRLKLIFLFNSSLYKNITVYNTRVLIVRSTPCILHVV